MKRKLCIFITALIMGISLCSCYADSAESISVIDGSETTCVKTKLVNGENYVCANDVFSADGMEVIYEESNKTLTAAKKKTTVKITENSITVDGEETQLSPSISDTEVYIPADTAALCIGAEIKNGNIVIESKTSDDSWKENKVSVNLTEKTTQGSGAEISGDTVLITQGGDYTLSGKLNGSVEVDTKDRVILRLNNAEISNSAGSAIYVKNADKCFIVLEDGSTNTISDTNSGNEEMKGAIFSEDDIEIKGNGSLTVNGNNLHAIAGDDEIEIESGNIVINSAVKDGIHANDGVSIKGGNITINAKGDGIQSEGYIEIEDGTVNITTTGEVSASSSMPFEKPGGNMKRGMMSEQSSDLDSSQMPERPSDSDSSQMPERPSDFDSSQMPERPSDFDHSQMSERPSDFDHSQISENSAQTSEDAEESGESSKGIKAETNIIIKGGDISVNSTDHSVHSADIVIISGGNLTVSSEVKKGISAHGDVYINDGDVSVEKSSEGIESKGIMTINGGNINVNASDDGLNAGGDSDMAFSRNTEVFDKHKININGGNIYINANGDGIDSNGSITVNGGTTIVDGPESNGNGAIDKESDFIINGGTIIACGSSGMVEMPSENSAQNVIVATFDNAVNAGTLTISDENGVIYEYSPKKKYQNVIFSSPDIKNASYTISESDTNTSLTAEVSSSVTTVGTAGRGFGGDRGRRGQNNIAGGQMPQNNPADGQMPQNKQ